jgi:adenylate cyclase
MQRWAFLRSGPPSSTRVQGYRALMAPVRSPEIESLMRRLMPVYVSDDRASLSNIFSSDASLRVLGFDPDERWAGRDEVLDVRLAQSDEMLGTEFEVEMVEAFEDGPFGWATWFGALVYGGSTTQLRTTAVFRLEGGFWRIVQWHNSVPVPNQQVFGVDLTTTLDELVTSVLKGSSQADLAPPSEGTMTLVFTDIVDSTVFAETVGDVAWADAIAAHEATIRRITAEHGGTVVKFLGDGSMLAFESARAAVRAAVAIQRASADDEYAVRIGIHTGEVMRTADDLFGTTVNKAARVAAVAGSGEVMASSTTRDLVGTIDGIRVGEPRVVALKGLSDTHQIVPLEWD